jgi:hypothetical protein
MAHRLYAVRGLSASKSFARTMRQAASVILRSMNSLRVRNSEFLGEAPVIRVLRVRPRGIR